MTAVWLLPIVACEVAASSGGLLLGHLAADTHAVAILLGSYVLWGVSVLPAFAILTILMLRLVYINCLKKSWQSAVGWLWADWHCCFGVIGFGASGPTLMASLGLAQLGQLFHQAGISPV